MATIGEIASRADVPIEAVLRVINGERVGADIERRVAEAIEELGPPHPALADRSRPEYVPKQELIETNAQEVVERAATPARFTVPEEVSSLVYEALRVEVGPVTQHVGHMEELLERLETTVEALRNDIWTERNERLDDLTLLVDLIVTGWQGVDRRLARLERAAARNGPQAGS